MKRGRISVTRELTESPFYKEANEELKKVFIESSREEKPFGIIEIHGYSELFDECKECESPQYDALFTGEIGAVKFLEFRKV